MKSNLLFYFLTLAIALSSCKKDKDVATVNQAYFGGKIINPTNKDIFILKSGVILDTVPLNNKNRFSYTFKNFEPGLYRFFDGREIQDFLVESNDSLMVRLNTLYFDESLVFTGKGAKENNFLMEMFLLNEKEDEKILRLGQKNAIEFDSIYSTLRDTKLKRLNNFKLRNETSSLFDEIAEASINYEYHAHKELYPLANYKISELDAFNKLPKDFYNYRDTINYNIANLKEFSPYLTFLKFHFNNVALQNHFKHSKDSLYNKLDLHYNLDKLELIDSKVENEDIKNNLLRNVLRQFINVSKNTEDYDKILQSFKEKSTSIIDKERETRFINSYKRLKPGNKIPSVTLLDKNNKEIGIQKLINKPTVLYFWTNINKDQLVSSHKRAKELNVKYPEFNFISINVDSISQEYHQKILKRYKLGSTKEYRFKSPKKAIETLWVKPILKVFILNKKGEIINAKANMFNIAFEQELLGVLN